VGGGFGGGGGGGGVGGGVVGGVWVFGGVFFFGGFLEGVLGVGGLGFLGCGGGGVGFGLGGGGLGGWGGIAATVPFRSRSGCASFFLVAFFRRDSGSLGKPFTAACRVTFVCRFFFMHRFEVVYGVSSSMTFSCVTSSLTSCLFSRRKNSSNSSLPADLKPSLAYQKIVPVRRFFSARFNKRCEVPSW